METTAAAAPFDCRGSLALENRNLDGPPSLSKTRPLSPTANTRPRAQTRPLRTHNTARRRPARRRFFSSSYTYIYIYMIYVYFGYVPVARRFGGARAHNQNTTPPTCSGDGRSAAFERRRQRSTRSSSFG